MRRSRLSAVDVGAGHIACAAFRIGDGQRLVLDHLDVETLNSDPAADACWLPEALEVLTRIVSRRRAGGEIRIAIPGHLALTKAVRTPAIDASRRAAVVQFEASQNIPYPLDEVVWSHLEMARDNDNLELLLMAVKRDVMQSFCDAVAADGRPPGGAMPACVALFRAFRHNYPEQAGGAVIVSVGARSTHVLLVEGARFRVRTVALGGNSITQSIAGACGVAFADAEALKLRLLTSADKSGEAESVRTAVNLAVEQFGGRLQSEIARTLAGFRGDPAAAAPAVLYLAGGGSRVLTLPDLLRKKLEIRVERFEPLRRVELAPSVRLAAADCAAMAEMVGVATGLMDAREPVPTLLPVALQEAAALRRRRPVLLSAAVLMLVALGVPAWHYHQLALRAQTERAALEAHLLPLKADAARNTAKIDRLERIREEIASLHSLAGAKSHWLLFFSDLQTRLGLVEDVWLERVSVIRAHGPSVTTTTPAGVPAKEVRLRVSGCVLHLAAPFSKASPESYQRAKRLLESLARSRFVTSVGDERFDQGQPGILRFDFTLLVNLEKPVVKTEVVK